MAFSTDATSCEELGELRTQACDNEQSSKAGVEGTLGLMGSSSW